ncbi:MAG: DUF4340 domain-containing protein [Planctomycetota bacterium]|nr:DUF4340 domain-containing protein [Planctomycetota bacterium]
MTDSNPPSKAPLMNNGTRFLLVATVVLGFTTWWVASNPTVSPGQKQPIFRKIDFNKISAIQVERGEGLKEVLRFEATIAEGKKGREQGPIWSVSKPVVDEGDSAVIAQMPTGLRFLEAMETFEKEKLGALRLDEPQCKITVEVKGEDPIVLILGAPLPGDVVGLKVEGREQGYIVRKTFTNRFLRPLQEYRNRDLFDADFEKTDEIRVVFNEEIQGVKALNYRFTRDDRFWHVGDKTGEYGDLPNIQGLFGSIDFLVAVDVLNDEVWTAETVEKYGLKPGLARIELKTGDKTQTLVIGKALPKERNLYYARFNEKSAIYTVNLKEPLKVLIRSKDRYRSRTLFQLGDIPLETITVNSKEGPVTIIGRDKRDWVFKGQESVRLDQEATKKLAFDLLTSKIAAFPSQGPARFDEAVVVSVKTGPITRVVRIGQLLGTQDKPHLRYVKRGERDDIYEASLPCFDDLKKVHLMLRDKRFISFDNSRCQQMEWKDAEGKVLRLLKKDERSFREEGVSMGQMDTAAIATLVKALQDLQATRYVALATDENKKKYGLSKPERTFVMVESDYDKKLGTIMKTISLSIGGASKKGFRYALFGKESAILEINDAFVELFNKGFGKKEEK